MRAAKVQASLCICAVSPEPSLLAHIHVSSESRGTFRQKARSLAPLNGWACAVKICHDGMLEDTNSLLRGSFGIQSLKIKYTNTEGMLLTFELDFCPGSHRTSLHGGILFVYWMKCAIFVVTTDMIYERSFSCGKQEQLSHVMKKPVYAICEQQRRRSACASVQFDQHLFCWLPR